MNSTTLNIHKSTPLSIIACVARVVTRSVDRLTGGRADYPHLVARGCAEALWKFGMESNIMFGRAAWIEILSNQSAVWATSGSKSPHFWVESQFKETIDLNMSVAHLKAPSHRPDPSPQFSPPILWSPEIPNFYRFEAEGVAEIDPQDEREAGWWKRIQEDIREHCTKDKVDMGDLDLDFPNEPILCPDRKLLDDSKGSFKHFDRALSIFGTPPPPF